ncbi:MAG: radical SAM protein, partial [Myxococcota bacterium]|nr:radical SAM protein [Myxococcota bacterium]
MKVPPRLFRGVRRVMDRVPTPARQAITREAWMAYRRGHELTHRLDYLFWETTRRCNLQCVHCGSTCTTEPLPDELTTAEIDDTLAAVARAYDPAGVMLVVTGGEPLVRVDLLEVMERAARRGSPWGMVTNGLLVDDAMIEPLERAGLRTVTVSLDGTEAHHDEIRQRPGSWRAALAALERLNASPYLSIVEAITTVNSINAADLEELLELLLDRGIRYWRIGTVAPIGRAKERPDLLADGEQLAAALELVARVRRDRPRVRGGGRMDLSFACENYVGERFEPRVRKHRFACWAGIRTAGILADGAIGACPDIDRHFVQGNI